MNFFNPFGPMMPFGGMVNPREQAISHLRAIVAHKESVVEAENRIERLEKEKQAIIAERDRYRLKNTRDVSSANRVQKDLDEGVQELWQKLRRTERISRIVNSIFSIVTILCIVLYMINGGYMQQGYFAGVLLVAECFALYTTIYSLFAWISEARTYKEHKEGAVGRKYLKYSFWIFAIAFLPVFFISRSAEWTLLGVLTFFAHQIPIMMCGLSAKMVMAIIVKCSYRKCTAQEKMLRWRKKKEMEKASENDQSEQAKYEKENATWLAQRRLEYAPKIADKEREIEAARTALKQIPSPVAYQLYPFFEKESGIGYIKAVLGHLERGKADTVKEAMAIQDRINDDISRRTMEDIRRQARQREEDAAIERLQAEARRTRAAEEERAEAAKKAADELERIRKEMEDKK